MGWSVSQFSFKCQGKMTFTPPHQQIFIKRSIFFFSNSVGGQVKHVCDTPQAIKILYRDVRYHTVQIPHQDVRYHTKYTLHFYAISFVMQDIIKRRHFDEIIKNYPFMMLQIIKLPLYVRYNKNT